MKSVYDTVTRLLSPQVTSSESAGYYERIPRRVGSFLLVTNEKGRVVFESTSTDVCTNDVKTVVTISDDAGGWSVICSQSSEWELTPAINLHSDRIERRRAMWHAAQYMAGRNLSPAERFSLLHQESFTTDANVFADDAFFDACGDTVTDDPFGEFLDK